MVSTISWRLIVWCVFIISHHDYGDMQMTEEPHPRSGTWDPKCFDRLDWRGGLIPSKSHLWAGQGLVNSFQTVNRGWWADITCGSERFPLTLPEFWSEVYTNRNYVWGGAQPGSLWENSILHIFFETARHKSLRISVFLTERLGFMVTTPWLDFNG